MLGIGATSLLSRGRGRRHRSIVLAVSLPEPPRSLANLPASPRWAGDRVGLPGEPHRPQLFLPQKGTVGASLSPEKKKNLGLCDS